MKSDFTYLKMDPDGFKPLKCTSLKLLQTKISRKHKSEHKEEKQVQVKLYTRRSLFQQIKQMLVRARESEWKSSRLTSEGTNLSVDEGERLTAVPRATTRLCNHPPLSHYPRSRLVSWHLWTFYLMDSCCCLFLTLQLHICSYADKQS